MSLKGSLEAFAIPEVLNLLADTSKSGELQVYGAGVEGRIWFSDGFISAFDVVGSEEPFEAIFELLRAPGGDFEFVSDVAPPSEVAVPAWDRRDVRPAIDQAQARMADWVEIVKAVPSLSHSVRLAMEAPADHVTVDRAQWALLVAIGNGQRVEEVLSRRNLPEFEGCKALKELIDALLAEMVESNADPDPTPEDVRSDHDHPEAIDPQDHDVEAGHLVIGEVSGDLHPVAEVDHAEVADISYLGESGDFDEAEREPEPDVEVAEVAEVSDLDAPSAPADHFVEHHEGSDEDGRTALRALLAEVTAQSGVVDPGTGAVDGLVDRGPWTSHELASLEQMGGWRDEEGSLHLPVPDGQVPPGLHYEEDQPNNVFPLRTAAAFEQPVAEDGSAYAQDGPVAAVEDQSVAEPEDAAPGEEPINRGLLLKFLSSVRN